MTQEIRGKAQTAHYYCLNVSVSGLFPSSDLQLLILILNNHTCVIQPISWRNLEDVVCTVDDYYDSTELALAGATHSQNAFQCG